jgi:predicted PurR-regulated permease PerM
MRHPLVAVFLLGLTVLVLWPVSQVFLVIFAAVLFAILVDGLAVLISHSLPVPQTVSRGIVIALMLLAVIMFLMVAGPRFSDEISLLSQRLPRAIDRLNSLIMSQPWGGLLKEIEFADHIQPTAPQILSGVTGVFSTAFEATANVVVIFFIGLYLAIRPGIYVRGVLHLFPPQNRKRGAEIMLALGRALRWWLVGRFTSMALVGLLTVLGLELIGLPLALVLGVIAGVFSFVPYIGPITSVIPAMLIGLMESPLMAVYALAVYVLVQFIEGNFLTPFIQQRTVSLPPAILLTAQFAMAIFYGLFGVLLATPLTVTLIVLIQMIYVQDVLKDPIAVLGTHEQQLG